MEKLVIAYNNVGNDRVFVSDGALCNIAAVGGEAERLVTDNGPLFRHPHASEVSTVYTLFYEGENRSGGVFVEPGQSTTAEYRLKRIMKDLSSVDKEASEVRAYCSVSYRGSAGQDGGDFVFMDPVSHLHLTSNIDKLPHETWGVAGYEPSSTSESQAVD